MTVAKKNQEHGHQGNVSNHHTRAVDSQSSKTLTRYGGLRCSTIVMERPAWQKLDNRLGQS